MGYDFVSSIDSGQNLNFHSNQVTNSSEKQTYSQACCLTVTPKISRSSLKLLNSHSQGRVKAEQVSNLRRSSNFNSQLR